MVPVEIYITYPGAWAISGDICKCTCGHLNTSTKINKNNKYQFLGTGLFLYHEIKKPEVFHVFRVYKKRTLASNGLMCWMLRAISPT